MAKKEDIIAPIEISEDLYYTVKNNDGKTVVKKRSDLTDEEKKILTEDGGKSKKGKTYLAEHPSQATSVQMSAKTGKITVTAPSYVLEREGFKDNLDKTLQTLTRYYNQDPNYKITLQDGTSKTVQEYIDMLNDPNDDRSIKKYVEAVNDMRAQEYGSDKYKGDRKTYGIGDNITLNDKYFTIRNAVALGDDAKDDTRQAISNLPEFDFMRTLKSYDSETGTASLKDIMENAWNRDKHSDEELRNANNALKRYFAQGDYSDTDELARNIAMYEFINGRHPDVNWFRSVFETTGAFFEGAWDYFVDLGGYIIGGSVAELFGSAEDASEDLAHAIFDTPDVDASSKDGIKRAWNDVLDYWEESKTARKEERSVVSGTQAGAEDLGYAIAKIVSLISVGDFTRGVVSTFAGSLSASAALGAQMSAEGVELSAPWMLRHGFTSAISVMDPGTAAKMANVISSLTTSAPASTIIGLLGETFGESISANPQVFYKVMNQKELSEEARGKLWEDFLGNSVGLGIGFSAGKAITKAGNTVIGQAMSYKISRRLYKIQNGLHNLANSVRFKFHGVDNAIDYVTDLLAKGKVKKADAYAIDEMLAKAKQAIASSDGVEIIGRSKEEILEQLEETRSDVLKMLDLENAVDEMRRQGRGVLSNWYSSGEYEAFQGTSKYLDNAYEALRKAESNASNLSEFRRVGKLAITQDSANYVKGVSRMAVIDSMLEAAENGRIDINVADLTKEKEALATTIAEYEAKATPEMLAAANALVDADRKWAREANNLLMREGMLSVSDIESMRASGIWGNDGELYTPLLREHHLDAMHKQEVSFFADGTVREAYKYSFGKNDDFLDPLAASRLYMSQYANKKARQGVVRAYQNISGVTNNELLNVAQTKAAKIASGGAMNATKDEIDVVVKDMSKDIRSSGLVNDLIDENVAKRALSKAESANDAAQASMLREAERGFDLRANYSATPQNMRAGALAMDNDEVTAIWQEGVGDGVDVKTYVVENYADLPRSAKAKIREQRDVMHFVKSEKMKLNKNKQTLHDFAIERMSRTLNEETGYETIQEWTESEVFANMSNSQRKKVLAKIYGDERASEIMESATAFHKGNMAPGDFASNEERIAKYQQNKAEAKAKLEADMQKRRDKYAPFIERQRYNKAILDGKKPKRTKLVAMADELDPPKKSMRFNGDSRINAENIDLALEVRNVKKLRALAKKEGFTPTDQQRLLLAKWEGEKFPRFSPGVKRLVNRYERLENMSDFPSDLKIKTNPGKATAEEMQIAIANAEYGTPDSLLGDIEDTMLQGYINETDMTSELFDEIAEFNPDFVNDLQRDIIATDPKFNTLESVQDAGRLHAYNTAMGRKIVRAYQRGENLERATEEADVLSEYVAGLIEKKGDEILEKISGRKVTNETFNRLAEYYGLDEATANKYFALRSVCDDQHRKFFFGEVQHQFKLELKQLKYDGDIDATARKFTKEFEEYMQSEYDAMRVLLQDSAPELVDQHGIFTEVESLAAQVNKLKKQRETVVAIQDDFGEVSFVETDPLVAHLLNYTYPPKEMGKMAKANYLMSKFFRLGTTGIRITSIVNQTFRDFGNAFIGGNVYRTWSRCVDEMRDVLGDSVVDWIEANDKGMADYIRKAAAETGDDVTDVAYSTIRRYGEAISPQATETATYKHAGDIQQSMRLGKLRGPEALTQKGMNKTLRAIDKAEDTLGIPNQIRESALRNAVYRNAFTDAVKKGYSYADAKTWATFAMNNATTNFGRATKMFSNLQDSVPFLGAAINGTKSFWRLLSVDPVGVMGRLVGGIILPTIALTAYSLHDEKNREAWKNLAEYQKDDNMLFAIDGKILSIPIPQELSAIVNPFRQLVEGMYDANRHSFWELAVNDVVGFSPIDLDGFVNIDAYTLSDGTSTDNFFIHNIMPGVSKLFAQLAPVPLKAASMYLTGIDPYTMKPINKGYTQVDPDTGESVIMGDYAGQLGQFVAYLFKDTPFAMSPTMAEKLLGSIFGKAPVQYTGWLIELGHSVFSENGDKALKHLENASKGLVEAITDPLYVDYENASAKREWKAFMSSMYSRRAELLNSDMWKDYMKKRRNATTPEELETLKKMRDNLVNPFYEDIQKGVENLKSKFGLSTFTAEKYASVISLSVLDQTGVDVSIVGQDALDDIYQDAKKKAVHTMWEMGFDSPADYSAFGRITTNEKGEVYIAQTTPMTILEIRNNISQAGDIHYANLEALLNNNGLTTSSDAYRDMRDEVDKIYAKKKLTNSDYKKINKLYKEWDVKVMEVLYPYINDYGIDVILNNSQVVDLLDNVIKVPSDYEINKKGYYISAPRLNKQRGFAQSYIKYLYKKMGGK